MRQPRTWRGQIVAEMSAHNDAWENVVRMNIGSSEWRDSLSGDAFLDAQFMDSSERSQPFTIWTKGRVYFCATYDSSFWCESVPRDPCDEVVDFIGR